MTTVDCPSCHRPLDPPVPAACPRCGLPLDGPLGSRLLEVQRHIVELDVERRRLVVQARAGAAAAAVPLAAVTPPSRPGVRPPHVPVLRAMGPQTLLATGGVLLLTIAAVVFTAVAWRDLPGFARGGLLAVAAAGSALATRRLVARELERTAEATAVLTVVLLGVLLNGLWRAGVFTLFADGRDIVAAGAAMLAVFAHLLAVWTRTRAPRVLVAWLAPTALLATGLRAAESLGYPAEPVAMGWTFLVAAIAAVVLAQRFQADVPRWAAVTRSAGVFLWLVAALIATIAESEAAAEDGALWVAQSGVLTVAVAAAALWARRLAVRLRAWWDPAGTAGAWLVATGVGATMIDLPDGPWSDVRVLLPAASGAAALWLLRERRARAGAVAGMVPVLWQSLEPFARTAAWLWTVAERRMAAPWSAGGVDPATLLSPSEAGLSALALAAGAVAVVAAVTAALRGAVGTPGRAALLPWVVASTGGAVVALALVVAVWPGGGGVAVTTVVAGGAALAHRRRPGTRSAPAVLGGATVVGVVLGLTGPIATIAALALAAGAAGVALAGGTDRTAGAGVADRRVTAGLAGLLVADLLGLTAAVVAAATPDPGPVGVAVAVAAAAGWAAAVVVRDTDEVGVTVEIVAAVGFAVAIPVAAGATREVWLAVTFAVLAVAATAVAALRDDRVWLRWIATGAGSASSWTVLAMLDVDVVEAYTVPPALVLLALGGLTLRARPDASSWWALGAGLGLLVTPTVRLIVEDPGDLVRVAVAITVGAVLAVVGRVLSLQAPLVSGVAALTVVALTQHDVVTDLLPRWVLLAAGGILLLWLSMSYERQLRRVIALRSGLADMR